MNYQQIKNLHHQILEDWKIIQDELESEIMRKHIYNCQMFVLLGYCKRIWFYYFKKLHFISIYRAL